MSKPEASIQKEILAWLKAEKIWHRRLPAQGIRGSKGGRIPSPLKDMPDLMFRDQRKDGVMAFAEIKTEDGSLSEGQEQTIWELEQEGFEVFVVRSLEEFTQCVTIKSFPLI